MRGPPGFPGFKGKCKNWIIFINWSTFKYSFKTDAGDKGEPGVNGANGLDGAPGKDGAPGLNGAPGKDGVNGKDGAPGKGKSFWQFTHYN